MNIFALDMDPVQCAKWHVDDHVIKMIIEYAQMLSTAHRVFDGVSTTVSVDMPTLNLKKQRTIKAMPGEIPFLAITNDQTDQGLFKPASEVKWYAKLDIQNKVCCMQTHEQHPCNIWVRQSSANYEWLFSLYKALADEFEYRRGKPHAAWTNWNKFLSNTPRNIPIGGLTKFATAMPDKYISTDAIASYKRFYVGDKYRFARWSKRDMPSWYQPLIVTVFNDDEHDARVAYLSNDKFATKTWVTLSNL